MIKVEVEYKEQTRPCKWSLEINGEWVEGYWHGFYECEMGNRDTIAAILEDNTGIAKAYDLRFLLLQFTDKPKLDAEEKRGRTE